MPRKKNDIPDELVNKWKIAPTYAPHEDHQPSSFNVPPKLEECISTFTIDKGTTGHCTCCSCVSKKAHHKSDPEVLSDVEVQRSNIIKSSTPPPRPSRPHGIRMTSPTTPRAQRFLAAPQAQLAPTTSQTLRPKRPARDLLPTEPEPMEGLSYEPHHPQHQQLTINNNFGPVPNALNLEVTKQQVENVLNQQLMYKQYFAPNTQLNNRNALPPVQELFNTADNPRQFPPQIGFVTNSGAELDLTNLTSKFMHFPEGQPTTSTTTTTTKTDKIEKRKEPEKSDSPPPQRHTI